ncbi:D-glycerate dehydrogenase [Palleronia sp. LCG004]|uniref:2-hydroxyacid dehydrogenase n=1 Tax=Palleronia sp. LCG004 TaxID=3079304 RepID=UPI002943658B|nr:D-glycerate dehydrogenase [Palleronia sp. LCG004]WOI56465.1 D-glycerate dehydrogenase [Palleronia sp. LCG004]
MGPERLSVVVTRRLPGPIEGRLAELFDATLRSEDAPMTREELVAAIRNADVLVPTITDRIDAGLLGRAGTRLKLVAHYGAGVDNVDVQTARQRGILVSNTPNVTTEDTADMTIGLMLSVTRRIPEGLAIMQRAGWTGWSPTANLGRRATGRHLGILGMGRIGRAVARRARAFGMQVHYHNRTPSGPCEDGLAEATYHPSLDQMLARIDVLSINCPHTPATFHLLNARRIALMKPTAVVINTSRGEVIDEAALARALEGGRLAGAGLDVFEHGDDVDPRLRALPNVVLLPHMGSATHEGRIEMGERVIANILAFSRGQRPPDQVVPGTF